MTNVLDASISPTPSECGSEWVQIDNSAGDRCYGSSREPSPSMRSVSSTRSEGPFDQGSAFSQMPGFESKGLSGLHPGIFLRPRVSRARSGASRDKERPTPQEPVTESTTSQKHGQNSPDLELPQFIEAMERALEISKNSGTGPTHPSTSPSADNRGESKEGQDSSCEVHQDPDESLSLWLGLCRDTKWLDGYKGDLPEPDGSM